MVVNRTHQRFTLAAALCLAAIALACETRDVTLTGILRSPNPGLSALTTSAGTLNPAFAAGTFSYQLVVDVNTPTITITPTVAESGASVTVNGFAVASGAASEPVSLDVGVNTVTIVTTAADGITKQTYTIAVTRTAT
jgi:hypothetical protein